MGELCPQLTSLHLTMGLPDSDANGRAMDPQLSRLLTPRLQQLTVAQDYNSGWGWGLRASSLVHLSALKQLTLDGMVLAEAEAEALSQGLVSLQQLRVQRPTLPLYHHADMVHLAPVLTCWEVFTHSGHNTSVFTSFVHLTRLVLCGGLPRGADDALAALTGLQELGLALAYGDSDSGAVALVQQAAGMGQLRSLQLEWYHDDDPTQLANRLSQCKQLTFLVLLVWGNNDE
jgi:hypothetical protein